MPDSAPSTPESAAPAGTPSGADVRPPDVAPGPDAAGRTPQASPRRRARAAIAVGVLLGAAGCGAYRALALNHAESTDKAYVQGNVVQITAQVPGTVVAILADDADSVKAGQALLRLDPADARVALDQAEAQLAQTVREVRTLYANNATYSAQITLREAELARTQGEVQRAQDDVHRRAPLLASGAVGQEAFAHTTPAGHQPQRPGRCPIGLAGGARGTGVQPKPDRRHRRGPAPGGGPGRCPRARGLSGAAPGGSASAAGRRGGPPQRADRPAHGCRHAADDGGAYLVQRLLQGLTGRQGLVADRITLRQRHFMALGRDEFLVTVGGLPTVAIGMFDDRRRSAIDHRRRRRPRCSLFA